MNGAGFFTPQQGSAEEQLLRKHLQAVYQDEQPFNQGFGSYLCPSSMRPKSLAVPGMMNSSFFSPSMFLLEPQVRTKFEDVALRFMTVISIENIYGKLLYVIVANQCSHLLLFSFQGPVMSMSPQATYLSTIIPNAVLPASIEVIEIDRSTSRTRGNSVNPGGSVRTVSKSSLASLDSSVSPMLSRRSDGDGSQTDNSTTMPTSASGSNWSDSQSSKTIILSSSPMSSKGSTHSCDSHRMELNGQESQVESAGDQDLVSVHSSVSAISSPSPKSENIPTCKGSTSCGSVSAGEDTKNERNCTRSLSIMKAKQPPAPPRRTNSLHSNKIRAQMDSKDLNASASREVATATGYIAAKDGIRSVTTGTSKIRLSVLNSAATNSTEASSDEAEGATEPLTEFNRVSPKKTPSEGGVFDRTMSPSSGYSSQSGTPTLSPKGISQTSPEKQKTKPVKPERSMSRASSSAASPSSSLTSLSSGTSEPLNQDVSTCCTSLPHQGSPLPVAAKELMPTLRVEVRERLNIPPPPRVQAPCPPPPETWVHNRRTFELLCGPCPNVTKVISKPSQIQNSTVEQAGNQSHRSEEVQVVSDKQTTDKAISESSEGEAKATIFLETHPEGVHQDLESMACTSTEPETLVVQKMIEDSAEVPRQEETSSPLLREPETVTKKDPPPIMKKPVTILNREELALTAPSVETQQKEMCCSATVEVHPPAENNTTSSQNGVTVLANNTKDQMDRIQVPSLQAHSGDPPKINKVSPPPTPPPSYHPTPPPSRKTPPSSVSTPPDELEKVQEEIQVVDSCWPPPPPPLEGGSVFDGGEEIDFPPPPPPVMADNVPDVMDSCATEVALPTPTVALEDVVQDIKNSSETETSVHLSPELPTAATQTVIDKPEGIMQVSKVSTAELSSSPVQNISSVSDSFPPPSIHREESPSSVSAALASPNSILKSDSLTIEDQTPSNTPISAQLIPTISVPVAPPLPVENLTTGVNFRRQPSVAHRDNRSKELLARHKSLPIPKEDANIPLVTPSLLQMVRLRSVNMIEDQVKAPAEAKSTNEGAPAKENCQASNQAHQNIPQKPIRKSLSLKSPTHTGKASSVLPNTPSMRLQEAIRMKTAAMSSRDGLPCRLGMRSSSCVGDPGILLKSPEGFDMLKSPASTASFIFSKTTKKLVIETAAASSPEAQASLKQNLATELMQFYDQSNAAGFSNGGINSDRVPPPVARKPAHSSSNASQNRPACPPAKMEFSVDRKDIIGAGQHTRETISPETTSKSINNIVIMIFCHGLCES